MRVSPSFSRNRLPGPLANLTMGLAVGLVIAPISSYAAPPGETILFQSIDLKIYRTLSRGSPVIVLTNVDAEGNLLSGAAGSPAAPQLPPPRPVPDLPIHGGPDGGTVRVVVTGEEGAPADTRDVTVTADGDTTVIININPPPAVEREQPVAPILALPFVVLGGLPGPFRYPEHHSFLGYGLDTSSPSMFGGLGLNAGNRFGLKTTGSCGEGYDCMFGPSPGRP